MDPALRHLLKKRAKLGIGDVTAATAADIDSYNRSEFKQSVFKSLYKPKTKNIISRTFIIPVTDGAVTGYLFEKVKDKAISGQNSLIILFHDGGWMLGNMRKCNAVCSNICDATGASVLAIDYRLAPQFKFPTPLEDCYEAFIWAAQDLCHGQLRRRKPCRKCKQAGQGPQGSKDCGTDSLLSCR